MKSQIIPVLLFCIAFPWIVARVYQSEVHHERTKETQEECFPKESFSGRDNKVAAQPVSYEELSTKQINFLIP